MEKEMSWGERAWARVQREAAREKVDLSEYMTVQEAMECLGGSESLVRGHFAFLQQITVGGRNLVPRKRVEWLRKKRAGEIPESDRFAESLAPYDVKAQIARNKEEEEERKRAEELARPKGFIVDYRVWIDYDNDDRWIPTKIAAGELNLTEVTTLYLGHRGKIRMRWADRETNQPIGEEEAAQLTPKARKSLRAMFSLRDVERYNAKRENEGRNRRPWQPYAPERTFRRVRARPLEELGDRPRITAEQAAARLGISRRRLSFIVGEGRLTVWQKHPNRRGSRLYFSPNVVYGYGHCRDRLLRREAALKGIEASKHRERAPHPEPSQWEQMNDLIYEPDACLGIDHGEFYTVRQAAEVLKVLPGTVRYQIRLGVLTGHRTPRSAGDRYNRRRWWFLKKEDVHDLAASSDHQKRRRAYLKGKAPWLFESKPADPPVARPPDPPELLETGEPVYGPVYYIPGNPRRIVNPLTDPEVLREEMRGW